MIEQVLINLMRNAIEALVKTASPKIELSADQHNRMGAKISVRDNGPGIKKEHLDQIFVPFFSTKESGSGIGLSLSRQIMKLHKGRIDVKSKLGEGTCFSLEF
jgi:signal transduction histidine kinase